MKKCISIIIIACIVFTSCTRVQENDIEASSKPIKTERYIGRLKGNISLYRSYMDNIVIANEKEEGFDIYSLDISSPIIRFEYAIQPQNKLLYSKQLDADRTLRVKQLGNSEENNVLTLEGKVTKEIAKRIAYSASALVATSPSQRYVVYCTATDYLNAYGLYLYDLDKEQGCLLTDQVSEELLNDMEGNIAWSPDEASLVVSNKLVFHATSGALIGQINAEKVLWSATGSKLAYIKSEKSLGKSINILDLSASAVEEVFIVNQGEYLPGYIVWNDEETKLAFVTSLIQAAEASGNMIPYHGIYSLNLTDKEAVRVDTILQLDQAVVGRLENMQYNALGCILTLAIGNSSGCDLYVYNIDTGYNEVLFNVEYLHDENNESYTCSSENNLYFIQSQRIVEMDAYMNYRVIYQSEEAIEDIYISKKMSRMIVIEKSKEGIILRQLENYKNKSM
ncbi:MAG: hypothetical protein K0Q99_1553 [Clostridia bacterium]|nr:hypothetical protein [Clostridia bacterium]